MKKSETFGKAFNFIRRSSCKRRLLKRTNENLSLSSPMASKAMMRRSNFGESQFRSSVKRSLSLIPTFVDFKTSAFAKFQDSIGRHALCLSVTIMLRINICSTRHMSFGNIQKWRCLEYRVSPSKKQLLQY